MEIKLTEIDRGEVLRYLGYRGGKLDGRVEAQLTEAMNTVLRLARPRTVYKLFDLERSDCLRLAGTAYALEGEDIRRHLEGCGECILMAVTLGAEIEREILRTQVTDMARAAVLDTSADAAVEQICDSLQCQLTGVVGKSGGHLTSRYSPGYGDMPLSTQKGFCDVLNTSRLIGLTVTGSYILTPRKSVTAILGVSENRVSGESIGCGQCQMADRCIFRKAGETCGK